MPSQLVRTAAICWAYDLVALSRRYASPFLTFYSKFWHPVAKHFIRRFGRAQDRVTKTLQRLEHLPGFQSYSCCMLSH